MTTGSSSESFQAPKGSTIGSGITSSLTLNTNVNAAATYTEVLTISLLNQTTLAVTNSFYQGPNTNGTLLTQFGGTNTSVNTFLTSGFNALAFGWYQKNTNAGTPNIVSLYSINIFGQSTAITGPPPITVQPTPAIAVTNSYAQFSTAAVGTGVGYQWYLNGAALANAGNYSGVNTGTLVITPAAATNAATALHGYYCLISGAGGYTTNTVTNSLTLVAPTNLVWVGTAGTANWDVDTSVDWETTNSSPVAAVFTAGDPVSFNDNTVVNANANLVGNVAPASISVATAAAFTFAGLGSKWVLLPPYSMARMLRAK